MSLFSKNTCQNLCRGKLLYLHHRIPSGCIYHPEIKKREKIGLPPRSPMSPIDRNQRNSKIGLFVSLSFLYFLMLHSSLFLQISFLNQFQILIFFYMLDQPTLV